MERHHFRIFMQLIKSNPDIDFLRNLDGVTREKIFDHIEYVILATDLSMHFVILAEYKRTFLEEATKVPYNKVNKRHRELLTSMIMTACDICSAVKPWEVHVKITGMYVSMYACMYVCVVMYSVVMFCFIYM